MRRPNRRKRHPVITDPEVSSKTKEDEVGAVRGQKKKESDKRVTSLYPKYLTLHEASRGSDKNREAVLGDFSLPVSLFHSFDLKIRILQDCVSSSRVPCLQFGDSDLSMPLTSAEPRRAEIPPGASTRVPHTFAQDRRAPLINRSCATLSSCSTNGRALAHTSAERSPGSFNYWQRRVCMRNACPRILR